jgi:hypothetical protein
MEDDLPNMEVCTSKVKSPEKKKKKKKSDKRLRTGAPAEALVAPA